MFCLEVKKGEYIIKNNTVPRCLFILEKGKIIKESGSLLNKKDVIEPGILFGSHSFYFNLKKRENNYVAEEDCII